MDDWSLKDIKKFEEGYYLRDDAEIHLSGPTIITVKGTNKVHKNPFELEERRVIALMARKSL